MQQLRISHTLHSNIHTLAVMWQKKRQTKNATQTQNWEPFLQLWERKEAVCRAKGKGDNPHYHRFMWWKGTSLAETCRHLFSSPRLAFLNSALLSPRLLSLCMAVKLALPLDFALRLLLKSLFFCQIFGQRVYGFYLSLRPTHTHKHTTHKAFSPPTSDLWST